MTKIEMISLHSPAELLRQIGVRLARRRKAMGWTQAELAERSGVALSTLQLLEREGRGSLQRLAKVALCLGLADDLQGLFATETSYRSLDEVEASRRETTAALPMVEPRHDVGKERNGH